ncbi:TonB-dependent hemoglobin/transferrin/lactoferrin family receptor [Simiduia litorea]|uniref:TonB-dependent hemoglobin/transferrin/lactoferrin family receptor n=1 Tax=Simiduia litorea TaxID=1435348 RepID=UPI0036F2665F
MSANQSNPHPLPLRTVTLALAIAAVTPMQSAAEEAEVFKLKSVLVSASRMAQESDKVDRSLTIIGRDELVQMQPVSIAEALKAEPNVDVAGGPRAYNQSVNIRGLEGNKVLQTIDGVQQRFESGHRPSYFLDPILISQIEVVKGPTSSLWGSGALGGVVASNTISASDLLAPTDNLGGIIKTGYTDNSEQSTTTLAVGGRTDTVDMLLSGYYRDGDNVVMGNGDELAGSSTRDQGVLIKADWTVSETQQLALNVRRAETVGQVPTNGSANSNGSSNFDINRDQRVQSGQIDYYLNTASPLLNAHAVAYVKDVTMDESRVSDNRTDSTQSQTVGLNISNVSELSGIRLLYGVDGYIESFDATREGANRPTPPEAETEAYGAFLQMTLPLAQRWHAEMGLRYDDFSTRADNLNQSRSDNATSPSAGIFWQTKDWLQIGLRHDQAFRAPSSEEMYSSGYHFCMFPGFCNAFVPNPDLIAETAANTEALAKLAFDNVWGQDALRINASVFENNIDNFIEQIVTSPSFAPVMNPGYTTWVNVDKATISGFEIAANYQQAQWQLQASYGQSRGRDDNSGADLTGIAADKLSLDGSYQFFEAQFTLGARLIHAKEQNRTDDKSGAEPARYAAYTVGDLYARWQPSSLPKLQMDLTLKNIGDIYYRSAWSELYEQGRAASVSAHYVF